VEQAPRGLEAKKPGFWRNIFAKKPGFFMVHAGVPRMITKGQTEELTFVSAKFKGCIQRAESDNGGHREHSSEDQQHGAERASDDAGEIQIGEQCSDYQADDTIDIGQIAFHG
jgi:hypothetical protein